MLQNKIQQWILEGETMACFQQETFLSLGDLDGQRQYPDSDVRFDHAPYFNFNDSKVKFDTNTVDNANENYGSVSGVVPKFLIITKGTLRGVFCFFLFRIARPDPAAEHSTYFVNHFL